MQLIKDEDYLGRIRLAANERLALPGLETRSHWATSNTWAGCASQPMGDEHYLGWICLAAKAVNRGDKRSRRVRDRDFAKFERSRRYRDRYRCQEKNSRRGRGRDLVFRDPPPPRTRARSLFADRDPPPPTAVATFTTTTIL